MHCFCTQSQRPRRKTPKNCGQRYPQISTRFRIRYFRVNWEEAFLGKPIDGNPLFFWAAKRTGLPVPSSPVPIPFL